MTARKNPVFEDIIITEEQKKRLKVIEHRMNTHSARYARNQIIGARDCCVCGSFPTKRVITDISGLDLKCVRVETYCNTCFEKSGITA